MTIDDLLAREAIRHTLASYNVLGDRLKVTDLLGCFTEDGVLDLAGTGGPLLEGREAIGGFFTGMGKPSKPAAKAEGAEPAPPPLAESKPAEAKPRPFVRHHISTCHIELTGADEADVRTYFAVWTNIGPDHCGVYIDRFRKVGDQWLIAHRQPRVDWTSPNGFFKKR